MAEYLAERAFVWAERSVWIQADRPEPDSVPSEPHHVCRIGFPALSGPDLHCAGAAAVVVGAARRLAVPVNVARDTEHMASANSSRGPTRLQTRFDRTVDLRP